MKEREEEICNYIQISKTKKINFKSCINYHIEQESNAENCYLS